MGASPDSGFDLATATDWHGVSPGMPRVEALRVLRAAGREVDEDDTDPEWALVKDGGPSLELLFAEEGDCPLRQLSIDDERCVWTGRPIIERRLHEVLSLMGDAARGACWRPEDAVLERFEDLEPLNAGPFTDEKLISDSTVWLPQRGLGLVMCEGVVSEIVWRRPEDLPRQYVGPVTEAQRQLSARPDLEEHLRKSYVASSKAMAPVPSSPPQKALTLLYVCGLAWLGWQALQEAQRWHAAAMLPAKLVAVESVEHKPFEHRYRVAFEDPQHRPQVATLERADFYVEPRDIGEEVQVAYVPGDPPRVKGPARAQDAAFIRYMPWFIALTAAYVALRAVLRLVLRQMAQPSPDVITRPVLPTNTGNG